MEDETRGDSPKSSAEGSGWTNTSVAAKALGVSPRTIQTYIKRGLLHGEPQGEGVKRTWYVSIDSLNALRAQRLAEGSIGENYREDSAEGIAEGVAEAMRGLAERLASESARAAEFRTRWELTERTESTLRESLARERERADRLEAELQASRRSWWRRMFGGPVV